MVRVALVHLGNKLAGRFGDYLSGVTQSLQHRLKQQLHLFWWGSRLDDRRFEGGESWNDKHGVLSCALAVRFAEPVLGQYLQHHFEPLRKLDEKPDHFVRLLSNRSLQSPN